MRSHGTRTGSTVAVTAGTFQHLVLSSPTPVAVEFWARWCPHCVMIDPILDELAETMKGLVSFVKVNVEDEQALAQRYAVAVLPTIRLFCRGREINAIVGTPTRSRLEAQIRAAIGRDRLCGGRPSNLPRASAATP